MDLPTRIIEAQASVVVLAGSETSSVALTAAVYYILHSLHVYESLFKESRGAFTTIEDKSALTRRDLSTSKSKGILDYGINLNQFTTTIN